MISQIREKVEAPPAARSLRASLLGRLRVGRDSLSTLLRTCLGEYPPGLIRPP